MRIPPDLTALLIKVRDFVFVLGPVLLIALTLVATFLALFTSGGPLAAGKNSPGTRKWLKGLRDYLEAGAPDREKLWALFEYGFPVPPPKRPAGVGRVVEEGAAVSASFGALLTATLLSPLLGLVRLAAGVVFFFLGRWLGEKETPEKTPGDGPVKAERQPTTRLTKNVDAPSARYKAPGGSKAKTREPEPKSFLARFWRFWSREFDYYLGRAVYNFLLAALLTIFVPIRVVEAWFGPDQWSGPLLAPLVGLLLRPGAPGTETALVLALFIKGAGTGSGTAALLAFPLFNLIGLAQRWQYYGLKPTVKYACLVWLVAVGIGLLLQIMGINANV